MMVFFLNAEDKIYARYGGRDGEDAENRMSLTGLNYTMQSVLASHAKEAKQFAPRVETKPTFVRDLTGGGGGRCLHCHQVKEAFNKKLVKDELWSRDSVYRFPLPENVGIRLDVDRSNIVEKVTPNSVAAKAGILKGDLIRDINGTPIHSFGDATFALDKAPTKGQLSISWVREGKSDTAKLELADGWRKTDLSWRPSMRRLIPTLPLYGTDLTANERKSLGLTEKQLAFRQNERLQQRAKDAGFLIGDIILGVDGQPRDLTVDQFVRQIPKEYLVGDTVTFKVIRQGKPTTVEMTLTSR